MVETYTVSAMLLFSSSVTHLIAREDFNVSVCCQSFRSYQSKSSWHVIEWETKTAVLSITGSIGSLLKLSPCKPLKHLAQEMGM
jgi:hypothetical protein